MGNYSVEANALVAGALAVTRKGCPDPLAAGESTFFEFLGSKPTLAREGDEMVLTSGEHVLRFGSVPVPSARAVKKFIYVAADRKPCSGVGPTNCLQVREQPSEPWRLYYGEIIGFTHVPGTEYRLRILEDDVPDPPADGSSKRWFLDLVVEQRIAK